MPAKINELFGPPGQRSNSDSTLLRGANAKSPKKSGKNRRVSESAVPPDIFTSHQPVIRRRIEAPSKNAVKSTAHTDDAIIDKVGISHGIADPSSSLIFNAVNVLPSIRKSNVESTTETLQSKKESHLEFSPHSVIPIVAFEPKLNNNISNIDNNHSTHGNNGSNNDTITSNKNANYHHSQNESKIKRGQGERLLDRKSSNTADDKDNNITQNLPEAVDERVEKLTRRPTLILPPIQTSRELLQK